MPLDPNIILSGTGNAGTGVDVNALLQQQMQGMANINAMERQRKADELVMQDREAANLARALAPAIGSVFADPSDEGLNVALGLVPEQYRGAMQAQVDQLRAIPDLNRRKNVVRAALVQDEVGQALLAQLEPTANARLNADMAAQRAALDARRLQMEENKLAAAANAGPKVAFRETDAEGNVRMFDEQGNEIGMIPKAGKPAAAGGSSATESERIAAYNAGRALTAAQRIAAAVEANPDATAPGMGEAFTNLFVDPNLIRSEERQRVAAAQREMIDALLTLATGAAYNKEQLEGQMESYIPRWTDREGTRADKRAALLDLIESAKIKAGRAWTPAMDAQFSKLLEGPLANEDEGGASETLPDGATTSNW